MSNLTFKLKKGKNLPFQKQAQKTIIKKTSKTNKSNDANKISSNPKSQVKSEDVL